MKEFSENLEMKMNKYMKAGAGKYGGITDSSERISYRGGKQSTE